MTYIPYRNDHHVTYVEWRVRKMLFKMRVWFRHRAFVAGREVDFLIPRPGRKGLLVEVDGDVYHLDSGRREAKDRILSCAGWEVLHFWGSEVLETPDHVKQVLKTALEGVPRLPKKKKGKHDLAPYCAGCDKVVCVKGCIPYIAAKRQGVIMAAKLQPTS